MNLNYFQTENFYTGLKQLFKDLNIPVNYIDDKSIEPKDILINTYKDNYASHKLMEDVYILGMIDDSAFNGESSLDIEVVKNAKKDYDGILIFGVTLKNRENNLLPTRTHFAEITRAFNREFHYMPVVVVFRYADDADFFISIANSERLKYKQEWREGEKVGKVSVLRDISISNPHTGHLKILDELKITRSGKKGINSFKGLYNYWQEVFSVSLLNKQFYRELSNWYFWAIKHVTFPSESKYKDDKNHEEKAKNVIRLLTRLLFIWFIKEKKLIPDELFDIDALQKNILNKISPDYELFPEENQESIYYKAILQNLFFATLNCPIKPDSVDSRERGFRGSESYGKHRGVDYLMRYKKHFQNPDAFLHKVNKVVPFLNGGLFECLDDKDNNIYIDGFSDNMTKRHSLIVPDYLFFGQDAKADLSSDYGVKNKATKESTIKGLINLLKSYKFTIAENTPIEEEVALDPELLGKVFENLLASYNPETKTTARKQTGSFYTPREIVNYMVDESLIAHLKNSVYNWNLAEKELDDKLHQLVSFEPINPFENNCELSTKIIHSLDSCKILDPACGSGAFPMGILQKMVHILQKVDPDNTHWKELQREKAKSATNQAYEIDDKDDRQNLLREIDEAFDESINNPDYARKLFLIENCIYGVDIQPIAIQISKLRFFISLVVEQKVNWEKENFGIMPLPNLETKFVTANTLIGIEKEGELFQTDEVKKKETELKEIRHKLFGAKTKATKVKYRKRDEELRNEIAEILKKGNLPVESAEKLASWDPYDQNGVSSFFDPEWMFDVKDGFDVVIGNPPYGVSIKGHDRNAVLKYLSKVPDYEIYYFFIEVSKQILSENGVLSYIVPNTYLFNVFAEKYRTDILDFWNVYSIIDFTNYSLFEGATVRNSVFVFKRNGQSTSINYFPTNNELLSLHDFINQDVKSLNCSLLNEFSQNWALAFKLPKDVINAVAEIKLASKQLNYFFSEISQGLIAYDKYKGQNLKTIETRAYHHQLYQDGLKIWLWGEDVTKYNIKWNGKEYIDYCSGIANPRKPKFFKNKRLLVREITNPSIFSAISTDELYNDPAIIIVLESKYSIEAVSIILNSKLGSFYHFNASPKATKGEFPKILVKDIKEFPISRNLTTVKNHFYQLIYELASYSIESSFYQSILQNIIDALVFELYFPEHMKERQINILQFVEQDIAKVMQNRDFETLNDSQKEQVIAELHKLWSNPNSEIVKRMNSFIEKSPDILKPILESYSI
jgi:tRNA1(Val) A37 N6-methylase TrmN6